jgi:tetratricopeptide (TPR) repeat protein
MKGGEKRLVFLCILLFAASLDVFAERSHDAAVSDLYVRNSYNLFSEGKMGEAGKLLDLALEFEEENPDALYLAGLIAGRGQKGLREAVRLFEKACSSSEWDIFSRSDAWFALGRALLSLREASASLRAFSEAREAQSANPEFYLFFSRALAESGETREAVRSLRAAVKGFPNNSALKRLLAAYDPQYITELSRQYFEVGDPSVFDAGLLEEAVRFAPNPGLKRRLIDEYRRGSEKASPSPWKTCVTALPPRKRR